MPKATAEHLVDEAIGTSIHALRCNPVSTLGIYSPSALVFNCDMFLNTPLLTDIVTLARNCQALIDYRLLKINRRRRCHEYKVNDYIFVNVPNRDSKLDLVRKGPFPIIQVHTNNTVTVQSGPVQERISICQTIPHKPT